MTKDSAKSTAFVDFLFPLLEAIDKRRNYFPVVSETGTSNSSHRVLIRLAVGASPRRLKTVCCCVRAVYVNMKPVALVPQVHP